MTKTPTPWATDIVKNPTQVAPVLKSQTSWGNNDVKIPSRFTPASKNTDAWGHGTARQTAFYNDRFVYSDSLRSYNYLLNGNTLNQLGQTAWKAS